MEGEGTEDGGRRDSGKQWGCGNRRNLPVPVPREKGHGGRGNRPCLSDSKMLSSDSNSRRDMGVAHGLMGTCPRWRSCLPNHGKDRRYAGDILAGSANLSPMADDSKLCTQATTKGALHTSYHERAETAETLSGRDDRQRRPRRRARGQRRPERAETTLSSAMSATEGGSSAMGTDPPRAQRKRN
jgi:hypothetical protein